jgi:hypothetical protein
LWIIENLPGIKNGLREHHVVGVDRGLRRSVRMNAPKALYGQRGFVNVLPPSKEYAPVEHHAGVEFGLAVDGNGMDVAPVRLHHVEDGNARIIAGNKSIVPHGGEDDLAIGQVGGRQILRRSERAMPAVIDRLDFAGLARQVVGSWIRNPAQPRSVQSDLVDGRTALGFAFEAEKDLLGVVGKVGIEVHPPAKRFFGVFVDDGADTVLLRRIGGILQHVNAAAWMPLVAGIVDMNALVVASLREENGRIKLISQRFLGNSSATDRRHQDDERGRDQRLLNHKWDLHRLD